MRLDAIKARLVVAWRARCRDFGADDAAMHAGTAVIEQWDSRELVGLIACFPDALPTYQGRRLTVGMDRYGKEVVVPGDKIPPLQRPLGIFPVRLLTGPHDRYIVSLSAARDDGADATAEVLPTASRFALVECLIGERATHWPTLDSDMRWVSEQHPGVTLRVYREARDDPHDYRVDWYRNGQSQGWCPDTEIPMRPPAPWALAES